MNPDKNGGKTRVVVTGVGAVSPIGITTAEMWTSLVAGKSGVGYISSFDTTAFDTKIAAEVKDFDVSQYVTRKQAQRMDRFTQFAVTASLQAAQMAKLTIDASNAPDSGVIVGNCVAGLLSVCEELKVLAEHGPRRINPILAPTMIPDAPSVQVSLLLGAKGINYAPSSACSSGADAIGHAYEAICQDNARVMIAGGTDAPIIPIAIAAFNNIRALSTRNNDPPGACRPFDAERDGFVMGEGAGMMILEDAEHAEKRGAPIIAELVGYANTSDAFHLTAPAPDGASAARAVRMALERANTSPKEVDYINAHGTATLLNDRTETNVIKNVFGEYAKKIPISASKSMLGHSLGAAGGIEAVITVLAMQYGIIPPTINLTHPDPECDLDYVPNTARKAEVKTAISNSFGFGGHNSVLVFKRYE
ncbi:MAG: beta-ketoacyl-[acyl-carrier-protein] synthase II [Chloroflexi bacterium RBG_16_50_11]|nr:MAG: beta-ketoacyl-[acyl-carrier-protein] synthase II [Chloroflexi bacterium RBG_16_50_11]